MWNPIPPSYRAAHALFSAYRGITPEIRLTTNPLSTIVHLALFRPVIILCRADLRTQHRAAVALAAEYQRMVDLREGLLLHADRVAQRLRSACAVAFLLEGSVDGPMRSWIRDRYAPRRWGLGGGARADVAIAGAIASVAGPRWPADLPTFALTVQALLGAGLVHPAARIAFRWPGSSIE